VIARQGLYADGNDDGTETAGVTRLNGQTFEEEAEGYLEEDPYGYVGLDAATGKESWKCLVKISATAAHASADRPSSPKWQ
jgi:hypothetical protein